MTFYDQENAALDALAKKYDFLLECADFDRSEITKYQERIEEKRVNIALYEGQIKQISAAIQALGGLRFKSQDISSSNG